MTLLDRVKAVKVRRHRVGAHHGPPSPVPMDQRVALAMAWVRDEISQAQLDRVLGYSGSSVRALLAVGCREAYRRGLLVEAPAKEQP